MNRFWTLAVLTVSLVASPMAHAQSKIAVRSVRLGAADVAKTAAFYQAVFGLKETQRIERQGLFEVIMNFGDTVEQARTAATPKIVIINRPADAPADRVSHLILHCPDIQAVVDRVAPSGGSIERAPSKPATSGSTIAFVLDPAGNRIELIMPAGT